MLWNWKICSKMKLNYQKSHYEVLVNANQTFRAKSSEHCTNRNWAKNMFMVHIAVTNEKCKYISIIHNQPVIVTSSQ